MLDWVRYLLRKGSQVGRVGGFALLKVAAAFDALHHPRASPFTVKRATQEVRKTVSLAY